MTGVGSMVARWLEYIETNREALDKMEMMYRDREDNDSDKENVPETCCISDCQCQLLGISCQKLEKKEREDETQEESVLREFQFSCGCSELCFSFRGQKVGSSNRTFCDGSVMSRSYRSGFLQGFSKTVGSERGGLLSVGKWRGGLKVGTWWEKVDGGGWVVSNEKIDNKMFLYPDLTTALVGHIGNPKSVSMTDLDICEVIGLNSDGGILVPTLKQTGRCLPVSSCE